MTSANMHCHTQLSCCQNMLLCISGTFTIGKMSAPPPPPSPHTHCIQPLQPNYPLSLSLSLSLSQSSAGSCGLSAGCLLSSPGSNRAEGVIIFSLKPHKAFLLLAWYDRNTIESAVTQNASIHPYPSYTNR